MMYTLRFPRLPVEYRLACSIALTVALVAAGMSQPGGDGTVAAQAVNPCMLLTTDEVQSLAPDEQAAAGVSTSLAAVGSMTCRYTWGEGTKRSKLDVVVNEAARVFPGMAPDAIKQRLQASVRAGTADAVIPEIGDAAVFNADSPAYAHASAYLKGRILQVQLDRVDARDKKDQMVALLKFAASRL